MVSGRKLSRILMLALGWVGVSWAVPMISNAPVPALPPNFRLEHTENVSSALPNSTSWIDCGKPQMKLHFTSVVSEPSIVHTGLFFIFDRHDLTL